MIYPSADTIEDKVKSRYSLVVLSAKRAKQIKEGAPVLIETTSTNPLTVALEEIAAGKVTATEVDGEIVPQPTGNGATLTAALPDSRADALTRADQPGGGDSETTSETTFETTGKPGDADAEGA